MFFRKREREREGRRESSICVPGPKTAYPRAASLRCMEGDPASTTSRIVGIAKLALFAAPSNEMINLTTKKKEKEKRERAGSDMKRDEEIREIDDPLVHEKKAD